MIQQNPAMNNLAQRLTQLSEWYNKDTSEYYRSDLCDIILQIFSMTSETVDVPRLEQALITEETIDVETLRGAVSIFEQAEDLANYVIQLPDKPLEAAKALEDLKGGIVGLDRFATIMDVKESALRMGILFDGGFNRLAMALPSNHPAILKLAELLKENLKILSDSQVQDLWAATQNEVTEDPGDLRLYIHPDVVQKSFFQADSIEDARAKLLEFVIRVRPKLLLKTFEERKTTVLGRVPGIGRILTWKAPESIEQLTSIGRSILRRISRIAYYWSAPLHQPLDVLAEVFKIPAKGRVLAGPEFKSAEEHHNNLNGQFDRTVFYECRALLELLSEFVSYRSPIELALRQYKLGLEVMAPENLKGYKRRNELYLQKELCKFLLEKNIFSVGTKFGRAELDLLAETVGESIMIEAKVCRSPPSEAQLKKFLVQLQSYMDQSPIRRRGALVIFNFSKTLIHTPRKLIKGSYWLIAINLLDSSPSTRRDSLAVDEGAQGELIVTALNRAPRSVKPKKSK